MLRTPHQPASEATDDALFGCAGHIVAQSAAMRQVLAQARTVARQDTPVLVHGEPGTGKTLIAHLVGRWGRQAAINVVDCRFPGVTSQLRCLEERVTAIAIEVAALDPEGQAHLARAIAERQARLVATTSTDLTSEAVRGNFRPDLLRCLVSSTIFLPPLRDRRTDIPPLVLHMLAMHQSDNPSVKGVGRGLFDLLVGYPWPGNANELQNVVLDALASARGEFIEIEDLPARVRGGDRRHRPKLDAAERRVIQIALGMSGWDVTEAAKQLGVSRATLYRRMVKLGLKRPRTINIGDLKNEIGRSGSDTARGVKDKLNKRILSSVDLDRSVQGE